MFINLHVNIYSCEEICRKYKNEHLWFNILCEISSLRLISHKLLEPKC